MPGLNYVHIVKCPKEYKPLLELSEKELETVEKVLEFLNRAFWVELRFYVCNDGDGVYKLIDVYYYDPVEEDEEW